MEEKEFRQFQGEVIDRLARIETRIEQLSNGSKPQASSWQTAVVEVVKVLVAALLALAGVKVTQGM